MNSPTVSVVIVSYGTRELTLAALESVLRSAAEVDLEPIVVDNDSPDDSADAIAKTYPKVRLLRLAENRGFGAGANRGAAAASGEWLLFLNSDARLPDGALAGLIRAATTRPDVGALGPRIERTDGKPEPSAGHFYGLRRDFIRAFLLDRLFPWSRRLEGIYLRPYHGPSRMVDWVSGACMLVRRQAFIAVDGFDEAYFLYVEDMDLCYRLSRSGLRNYYVPEVLVLHELGKSRRRDSPILLEGGGAPEYFVRKYGIHYPRSVQRLLRAVGFLNWLIILEVKRIVFTLRGRDVSEIADYARLCRRSLVGLFTPKITDSHFPRTDSRE